MRFSEVLICYYARRLVFFSTPPNYYSKIPRFSKMPYTEKMLGFVRFSMLKMIIFAKVFGYI